MIVDGDCDLQNDIEVLRCLWNAHRWTSCYRNGQLALDTYISITLKNRIQIYYILVITSPLKMDCKVTGAVKYKSAWIIRCTDFRKVKFTWIICTDSHRVKFAWIRCTDFQWTKDAWWIRCRDCHRAKAIFIRRKRFFVFVLFIKHKKHYANDQMTWGLAGIHDCKCQ